MASVQLAEKPPLHHANKSPASSPATRRRKVNRQAPVPRRRQSSPGRLKRDKTLVRRDSDSNSDNDSLIIEEEETETVENNNRPRTLPVRSHSNMEESTENGNYKAKNNKQRSFEKDPHSCSIHNGLGSCNCKRRRNTVLTPGISPDEVMEKETKLIVLEYLSSLSIEELTARNKTSRASSFNSTSQEDFTKGRKSEKANTVTFGETERKAILEHLAKQAQEEDLKNGKRLGRSTSDVSEKQYEKMRCKLRQMKVPLKKWMDVNLKQELLEFDTSNLKKSPRKVTRRSMSLKSINRSTVKSPLKLTIPRRNTVYVAQGATAVPEDSPCLDPDSLMTPDTFIVSRLEEISEEIMMDYPDLLQKPISDLLMPLSNNKNISYDAFKSVAKSVFDLELARVTPTVWSRVALTLYLVKETMFLGNLNDTQLELLVDYSTKFLKSNAKDDIEKEGGWDSLDLDIDESMIWAGAYDAISTDDDEDETKKQRKISRKEMYRKASFREQVSQTVAEWSPIGMAAMLVAIGIAYSYVKT